MIKISLREYRELNIKSLYRKVIELEKQYKKDLNELQKIYDDYHEEDFKRWFWQKQKRLIVNVSGYGHIVDAVALLSEILKLRSSLHTCKRFLDEIVNAFQKTNGNLDKIKIETFRGFFDLTYDYEDNKRYILEAMESDDKLSRNK